jgi:flagellar basal-body rod protein FlgC
MADNSTSTNSVLAVASSALRAQQARMRVIAENIANADSAGRTPDEEPYRRRIPTFKAVMDADIGGEGVQIGKIMPDMSDFETRYEPGHPAADAQGYVRYPNVDSLVEAMDMREAQRTYEANLNVVTVTRQMLGHTLDILKG